MPKESKNNVSVKKQVKKLRYKDILIQVTAPSSPRKEEAKAIKAMPEATGAFKKLDKI